MALCDSHSGSHWLSLPLSGILWPSLALYCSLILRIQSLIGSQGPCSALSAVATLTHFLLHNYIYYDEVSVCLCVTKGANQDAYLVMMGRRNIANLNIGKNESFWKHEFFIGSFLSLFGPFSLKNSLTFCSVTNQMDWMWDKARVLVTRLQRGAGKIRKSFNCFSLPQKPTVFFAKRGDICICPNPWYIHIDDIIYEWPWR